ncbi:hypothetical protein [Streptomyces silvisoli]|uniref:Secreted protein n=1 Tax=Streptomyces silvisoli TaxID=3034235 RepID=A0ABT5ZRD9_9ACTN|nr:hypothetical protein [Streptomyces silvisoli]MDF3292378.1 hypothetical protein [Streptomyces silvisoli]
MKRTTIRVATVAMGAAMVLVATGPLASAAEANGLQRAEQNQAAVQLASTMRENGVPPIVEDGLDDRLAALPTHRTLDQVLGAMYPGDEAAQATAKAAITGGSEGPQFYSFWGTTWKYTKCVAAVGAAFIPTSKAYKAIKELGGVAEAAKLLVMAGDVNAFKRAAGNAALDILGIGAIQSNCF